MISETKHLKNIPKLRKKQQSQSQKEKVKHMFGTLLAGFLAFLAIITAYYTFAFKLTILPSETIDAMNPFATPFVLKNDSLLWINKVRPHRLVIRNVNKFSCKIKTELIAPPIPYIASGESTTFTLPVAEFVFTNEPINYLNIEVVVYYYPAFIPFYKKEKQQRFVTIQSKDGKLQWVSKAMSE
jgi:hypothetical protein